MPKFIENIIKFLEGKRTYLIAILAGVLGLIQSFGVVIPEYIYVILGALGLGTLRAAVK